MEQVLTFAPPEVVPLSPAERLGIAVVSWEGRLFSKWDHEFESAFLQERVPANLTTTSNTVGYIASVQLLIRRLADRYARSTMI